MGIEGYWTLAVVGFMLAALARDAAGSDAILFTALALLVVTGVLTPAEALAGFSNTGVITIALLFIVSAAIHQTGALNSLVYNYLGSERKGGIPFLLLKMMLPVAALSAFLNNTAIVAIFTPIVKKWTEKLRLPPSKFFIPLSYATVLGGLITLIGTSTNLVVHGLMLENGLRGFSLFELAAVGIPCTIAGIIYLVFFGEKLLPHVKDVRDQLEENPKEYVVEMKVKKECPLIGQTIKKAGLRNLRGLFLIDIEREGRSLGPISSSEVLMPEDRLMFVGVTSAVVDLQDIPGLVPAHEMFEKDFAAIRTHLVEAVVSSGSPILGKTVKECNFRAKYGAGVVAVHRNGERIQSKIGDIPLKAGDTLLLFTPEDFVSQWKDSQDFYLMSQIKDKPPDMMRKAYLVLGITVLMILGAVLGEAGLLKLGNQPLSIFHTVFAAVVLLFLTRALEGCEARRAMRLDILITIACAFGISRALQKTGAADSIAETIIQFCESWGPVGVLIGIYLLANIFTEVMTNNAAAALTFPIALSVAARLHVDPMPFVVAITVSASAGFATPLGYQTHLMVQGAGGYKFRDYLRTGPPLNLICFAIAVFLIPLFWPF